jgi:hypothetical protein
LLVLFCSGCGLFGDVAADGAEPEIVQVEVWANSEAPGYEAFRALDGNPGTIWHTEFVGNSPSYPHELVIDLGSRRLIEGFTYRPRPGQGNGTVDRFECWMADREEDRGVLVASGRFLPSAEEHRVAFPQPAAGRYVRFRALSEIRGNPWASAAELTLWIPNVRVVARPAGALRLLRPDGTRLDPWEVEFELLARDLRRRAHFARVSSETYHPQALVWDSDRDPADIALRRLEALIQDLESSFGLDLREESSRLERLREKTAQIPVDERQARRSLFREIVTLRRSVAFRNPLLDFDRMIILKRHLARFNHMCDQYYGINAEPGGGIFILHDPFGPNPRAENLLADVVVQRGRLAGQKLEGGAFLSPDLSPDAQKLAFAYVECRGDRSHRYHTDPSQGHWDAGWCYHIFTVRLDGTQLWQLTDGTWNDFDPCWLPNGRIAFISERRGGYLRCGRVCPTYTLFDMAADGSQIRALSIHETNEWNPAVTHDGRIVYTRWDYVDRHGVTAHMPWVTTLDGRDSRAIHGNFAPRHLRPDMELDCQPIPGSPKLVATAAPHHGQAFGSLVIVDPRRADDDAMGPVRRLTPEVGFPESQQGGQAFGSPWPLSEKYFLCAFDPAARESWREQGTVYHRGDYGIYLVDAFGNKELVYYDPEISCQNPIPLRPRPMPHLVPEFCPPAEPQPFVKPWPRDLPPPTAQVAVMNVYDSLLPLPPGTEISALRVIQILPMTVPSGGPPHEVGLRLPHAGDSVMLARYVLGTVPVEPDGSAFFEVPAGKEIFFQILDQRGLAVQSMRSATYLKPGERLVCKGCHDPRHLAPEYRGQLPLALRRPPSRLVPEVDGANPFSFAALVQPVLDRKCVSCHQQNPQAPPLTREPIQGHWYTSYVSLARRYGFWDYGHAYRTIPGRFGARASRLLQILEQDHYGVQLTEEELRRLTLWLDLCSIFYGVYEQEGGQAQLRGETVYPTLE